MGIIISPICTHFSLVRSNSTPVPFICICCGGGGEALRIVTPTAFKILWRPVTQWFTAFLSGQPNISPKLDLRPSFKNLKAWATVKLPPPSLTPVILQSGNEPSGSTNGQRSSLPLISAQRLLLRRRCFEDGAARTDHISKPRNSYLS